MTSTEARRKEYWARINRAVDYIETHLAEEMSLRDIASAAFFSPYHFHRILKGLMGGSQESAPIPPNPKSFPSTMTTRRSPTKGNSGSASVSPFPRIPGFQVKWGR
jgi:hypothetical protein